MTPSNPFIQTLNSGGLHRPQGGGERGAAVRGAPQS